MNGRVPARAQSAFGVARACVLGLALLGALGASAAETERAGIRHWLARIHEAAGQRNFQGTFVVTSSGAVTSARIAHYSVGSNQYERIESLDGPAHNVYRHNDVVHTVWPERKVVLVEQRDRLRSFPAVLLSGDYQLADHYELRRVGGERVAGHQANVIELKARDELRYGYRLWSDVTTGLLLRSDVTGAKGEVLESSAFSDVVINVRPQPDSVLQPMRRVDGMRVVKPKLATARLEDEGWLLRNAVAGFRPVSSVRRSLPAAHGDADAAAQGEALQAIYADGLAYVSLFIEAYDATRHARPLLTVSGATHTLTRRLGEHWLTLVGDVPAETLRAFAKSIERAR